MLTVLLVTLTLHAQAATAEVQPQPVSRPTLSTRDGVVASVRAAAAAVPVMVGMVAWGAVAGAALGAVTLTQGQGGTLPGSPVGWAWLVVWSALTAGAGALAVLPAALAVGALADAVAWMGWGSRGTWTLPFPDLPMLGAMTVAAAAVGAVLLVGALAGGTVLATRFPHGGWWRNPLGTALGAGAAAGAVVLFPGLLVVGAGVLARGWAWARVYGLLEEG